MDRYSYKERDIDIADEYIYDNKLNMKVYYFECCDLLNYYLDTIEAKNKIIEELKDQILKLNDNCRGAYEKYSAKCKYLHENEKQIAINELEILKQAIYSNNIEEGYLDESVDIYSLIDDINNRIKELKEELYD